MKNPFKGLSMTTTKSTGTSLTMKNLQDAFEYFKSFEYLEKESNAALNIAVGERIVNAAYKQKIINQQEAMRLFMSIEINRGLIVSPKMQKRLKKIKPENLKKNRFASK